MVRRAVLLPQSRRGMGPGSNRDFHAFLPASGLSQHRFVLLSLQIRNQRTATEIPLGQVLNPVQDHCSPQIPDHSDLFAVRPKALIVQNNQRCADHPSAIHRLGLPVCGIAHASGGQERFADFLPFYHCHSLSLLINTHVRYP